MYYVIREHEDARCLMEYIAKSEQEALDWIDEQEVDRSNFTIARAQHDF